MSIRGCRVDNDWYVGSTNYALRYVDGTTVALTGTVAGTSGAAVITGTGTAFRTQLTKVGDAGDQFQVDGKNYAIASIDSDTQITLSTNLTTSPSGASAYRIRNDSAVDVAATFSNIGDDRSSSKPGLSTEVTIKSRTKASGMATIVAGDTSVVVTHGMRRIPIVGEIMVTPHTVTATVRTFGISAIGINTFQINMSSSAGSEYVLGWRVELMELN
jgi:hypothetical protein